MGPRSRSRAQEKQERNHQDALRVSLAQHRIDQLSQPQKILPNASALATTGSRGSPLASRSNHT